MDINAKNNYGETVLYKEAVCREWEVVKWLVEHGADVNVKTNDGRTALHYAADSGNDELVQWLKERGAEE